MKYSPNGIDFPYSSPKPYEDAVHQFAKAYGIRKGDRLWTKNDNQEIEERVYE